MFPKVLFEFSSSSSLMYDYISIFYLKIFQQKL